MKLKQIINVINYMVGEIELSDREIYQLDINKDGVVDEQDLILMWEMYATNANEIKNSHTGKKFRQHIKKLFKSNKYSVTEMQSIASQISNISYQHIVEIESKHKMVKTEKDKKLFNI